MVKQAGSLPASQRNRLAQQLTQAVLQNKTVDPFLLDMQQRVFDARS